MKRSYSSVGIEPVEKYQKTNNKELVKKLIQDIDGDDFFDDLLSVIKSKYKLSDVNNSKKKGRSLFAWACLNGKIDIVKELIDDKNTQLKIKGNSYSDGFVDAFVYLVSSESKIQIAKKMIYMILERKEVDLTNYLQIFRKSIFLVSSNRIRPIYKDIIRHPKFPKNFDSEILNNRSYNPFNYFFIVDLLLKRELYKKNNKDKIKSIFNEILYKYSNHVAFNHYLHYKKKYKKILDKISGVFDYFQQYSILFQLGLVNDKSISYTALFDCKNTWVQTFKYMKNRTL